jgi:hypothetical protein
MTMMDEWDKREQGGERRGGGKRREEGGRAWRDREAG